MYFNSKIKQNSIKQKSAGTQPPINFFKYNPQTSNLNFTEFHSIYPQETILKLMIQQEIGRDTILTTRKKLYEKEPQANLLTKRNPPNLQQQFLLR